MKEKIIAAVEKHRDLILSANGMKITDMEALKRFLYTCKMGDSIQLQVNRFGTILTLTVKLGEVK